MLYACGSNGAGQLGLGHTNDVREWTRVDLDSRVVAMAGGGNHTALVDDRGRAFVTSGGRLAPVAHPAGARWLLVAATWDQTFFVDGRAVYEARGTTARLVYTAPTRVLAIKAGLAHTVLLTASGLFGFGRSSKGQCGVVQRLVPAPHRFPLHATPGLREFACGRDYTVVLTPSELLVFGNTRHFAKAIPRGGSYAVLSAWTSVLLLPDGRQFGNNSHGQLEPPFQWNPKRPADVALGSEHGIAVVDGEVVTWGWGEHGNCPPPHAFGSAKVFAGCATSFVQTCDD